MTEIKNFAVCNEIGTPAYNEVKIYLDADKMAKEILKDEILKDEELDEVAGGAELPTLQPNQQGYYPQPNWNVPPRTSNQ